MPGSFAVTAILVAFAPIATAQLTRGYISGTIDDPSGAVVQDVKISIENMATGIERSTLTNHAGVYRFAAVEPGVYKIEFAKPGFRVSRIESVEVGLSSEVVLNQTLQVAESVTAVDVQATAAGVDLAKATPTVEQNASPVVLQGLPLNKGRNVIDLMALAPGSVRLPRQVELDYTMGGQRVWIQSFLVDGLDIKHRSFGFPLVYAIPESISEYRLQTSAYSAEFGRGAGAVVSSVSRSGTNGFHGSAWEYFTANWLAARTLADKRAGLAGSRYLYHEPGATFGGPLRKERTFFFLLFDVRPERLGWNARFSPTVTIPTPAGYEALQRVPLRPGQSAASRQSVLEALSFLRQIYQVPLRFEGVRPVDVNGVGIPVGATRVPITNALNRWHGEARLDHKLTGSDSISVLFRTNHGGYAVGHTGGFALLSNISFGNMFGSTASFLTDFAAFTHTRVIGARSMNEFRFGLLRNSGTSIPLSEPGPALTVVGAFTAGANVVSPWAHSVRHLEWQDVFTTQRGRHALKAGADITLIADRGRNAGITRGVWTFNSLSDLVNNASSVILRRFAAVDADIDQVQQSYFFQDDFKAGRNLTVNAGIRYQTANPPMARYGAATPDLLAAGAFPPMRRDSNDWAPRFGFAWNPKGGGTVLRGGFGITHVAQFSVDISGNYPTNATYQKFFPETLDLFPQMPPLPPAIPPLNPALETFSLISPDAQNSATNFYNVSVQRQFGAYYIFEAGYMGNRGLHLQRTREGNPAILTPAQSLAARSGVPIPGVSARRLNPTWGSRVIFDYGGSSLYNATYVRFDRKLSRGLVIGANYTYSSTIDDGDGYGQDSFDFHRERARAFTDRPHRFVIHYVWQMPPLSGRMRLLGGWQIGGYSEWQSGEPFTVVTGVDSNGDGCCGGANPPVDRPDYNPNGILRLDPVTGTWRSFSTPLSGGIFATPLGPNGLPLPNSVPSGGNLGRNTFRGPAYANVNFSLLKRFVITERWQTELRVDWSNFLNHRNFGPPVLIMSSAAFGSNASNPPSREALLGFKIRF
jgi:hypothetical protein